ncbi:MAG: hypothetical protein NZ555_05165 [Geminicoccaceae bacterium]|nr:hypothetical protein [Geminicoccaceae bacterium]MCX8102281.1 hypothetical protein [Geminicoccaceae bacterium]MDW8370827.1 hypothetical protein [Geminicoccaceae bacterium]
MPSICRDPHPPRPVRALACCLLACLAGASAPPLAAKEKSGQLCEIASSVSGEGQLRDRTRKCRKDDVLIVAVVSASIAPVRVAALACDLSDQVLIEETTESPGIARVTCTYAGDVRGKR